MFPPKNIKHQATLKQSKKTPLLSEENSHGKSEKSL
jgi:hypothetical protein